MPRSIFLGRIPGDGEPLWTDSDRAWAMALLSLEADNCPGCGHPRSESMATQINERGHKMPAHVYKGEALVCYACQERDMTVADYDDHKGLYFTVRKIR